MVQSCALTPGTMIEYLFSQVSVASGGGGADEIIFERRQRRAEDSSLKLSAALVRGLVFSENILSDLFSPFFLTFSSFEVHFFVKTKVSPSSVRSTGYRIGLYPVGLFRVPNTRLDKVTPLI